MISDALSCAFLRAAAMNRPPHETKAHRAEIGDTRRIAIWLSFDSSPGKDEQRSG
jgi:hypothetical protein